eukprot:351815-Chlamydomonas_euryale.AAC.6
MEGNGSGYPMLTRLLACFTHMRTRPDECSPGGRAPPVDRAVCYAHSSGVRRSPSSMALSPMTCGAWGV